MSPLRKHPLAYRTHDAALAARMNIGAMTLSDLEIVRCAECGYWHIERKESPYGQQPAKAANSQTEEM